MFSFSLLVTVFVAISSSIFNRSHGQTNLFPFGVDDGDSLVPTGVDVASEVSILNEPIVFFGSQYRQIIVNSNGVLSLGGAQFTDFFPRSFPLSSRVAIIAPFWFDFDSTKGGDISYRQTTDSQLLQRVSSLVRGVYDEELVHMDFHPTQLFIATWYQVAPFFGSPKMNNTFQVVLGTDTLRTVAMFIYDDIQSGSRAQIGFDAGDRITSFTLPGALTSQTLDMEQSTNIETPGVFIYRLDNLQYVMCSSGMGAGGCTSYDLGNTTLVDCCSGSTGGLFYTFLAGREQCNLCERALMSMVECCSTEFNDCSSPDLGFMTAEECCVNNQEGLSFIVHQSGGFLPSSTIFPCIVVGWLNKTFVGSEQEEGYKLFVGFTKGAQEALAVLGPIEICVETDSIDNIYAAVENSDYVFTEYLTLGIEPVAVEVTFLVDNVALEFNETAALRLVPTYLSLTDIDEDYIFIRERIEMTIVDTNVLDISLTANETQVQESSNVTVKVCKNNVIAKEFPDRIEVFLSSFTIENFGEPLPFNIPSDNPFSPNRANAQDFEEISMRQTFIFYPSIINIPDVMCESAVIHITDDNINEADQTFVIQINVVPEIVDLITMTVNFSIVQIIDNDDISFSFEQQIYTFIEPPAMHTYPIFLVTENETEQTFNITFQVVSCQQASFINFSQSTISPNSQRTQYDIVLFPNITEMAEGFCVSSFLSALGQHYVAVTSIVIVDPATPIGFSRHLVTAREDISAVSISVFSYIPVVSEGLVTYFTTSSLDATEGKDYEGVTNMPVYFVNGSDIVVIMVDIVDDDLTEGVENFTGVLIVSDPANPALNFNTSITVQILDNDDAGVCGNTFMGRTCSENALCYLSGDNRLIQSCSCKDGYIGNGSICQDIDECSTGLNNCHDNADCNNTDGGFECHCKPGYVGDGFICIDFTKLVPGPCNNSHSYCECTSMSECGCLSGFQVIDEEGIKVCEDINECMQGSERCNGTCNNTIGSFDCSCPVGFAYDSTLEKCIDVDECQLFSRDQLGCSENAECINTIASYECRCKTEYYGDGMNCFSSSVCKRQTLSSECECQTGFYFESNTARCEDINECKISNSNNCDKHGASCINTVGSYTCSCNPGFVGNGITCYNIDECELGLHTEVCDEHAVCIDNEGSFTCRCVEPFFGDGRECREETSSRIVNESIPDRPNHDLIYPIGVDFCLESNHSFPNNVTVQCRLDTRSRLTLLEISVTSLSVIKENMEVVSRGLEITLTQDDLSVLFEQDNAQVTVTCRARNDRQLVEDMRLTTIRVCASSECQDGFTNNCSHICTRTNLTEHECSCNPGFELGMDISFCSDVNECRTGQHNCSVADNQRCVNEIGSFRCECAPGFVEREGGICEDIIECEGSNNSCSDNERCVNTIGSFNCECKDGYTRMNSSEPCQNVDECASEILNNCSNSSHRECKDTPGSFVCQCDEGFRENIVGECVDINECEEDMGNCSGLCQNTVGSFFCACNTGFLLDVTDNSTCLDIDECDPGCHVHSTCHDCGANSRCVNTLGSFNCDCNQFYQRIEDTMSCKVSDEVIIGSTLGLVLFLVIIGVVIVSVLLYWHLKRHKKVDYYSPTNLNNMESEPIIQRLSVQSSYKLRLPPHLIMPSLCLKLEEPIGQGEFGIVYKGYVMKNQGQVVSDIVAIKTLKGFYDSSAVREMLKECARMYTLNHPNVLTLRGVCVDGGPAPYIIMPFMANGSLLAYLKKERAKLVVSNDNLDAEEVESVSKQLMDMCIQVARGMEYIATKKVVHRDLAARNCMIDVNFVIKVADFGLCESLETKEYFRQDKSAVVKLPVKWLAPESMEDYIFSEKSDVWAYGVTCWEIFSGGKVPYPNMDIMELPKLLRNGLRLDKPENGACSGEMYTTMLQCWEIEADKRPTFSALVDSLSKDLEVMANYMDLQSTSGSLKPLSDNKVTIEEADSEQQKSYDQLEHSSVIVINSPISDVMATIEESNSDESHF